MDLADLLASAQAKGFTSNFALEGERLRCSHSDEQFEACDARVVDSQSVDAGTDPGDDATIYLIETRSGRRGYLLVSDSFHANPQRAGFIDRLLKMT
jgi:hypothetical protein